MNYYWFLDYFSFSFYLLRHHRLVCDYPGHPWKRSLDVFHRCSKRGLRASSGPTDACASVCCGSRRSSSISYVWRLPSKCSSTTIQRLPHSTPESAVLQLSSWYTCFRKYPTFSRRIFPSPIRQRGPPTPA